MLHQQRMALFSESDLYVVITQEFCVGRAATDILADVLAAGVSLIQLREKGIDDRALYQLGLKFREQTDRAGALLIVDDRPDIALAINADGVHLGQSDMPVSVARAIAPDLIIGSSSHNLEEALAAQDAGASYTNIGPIFTTQTKSVPTGVIGLDAIDAISPHLNIPFTCMGGIKEHNIGEVASRGARHVAVVTAVTAAGNPREAALLLREKLCAPDSPSFT